MARYRSALVLLAAAALLALSLLAPGTGPRDRARAAGAPVPAALLAQAGVDPLEQCGIARESCEINSRRCHASFDYENQVQAQCLADRKAVYRKCLNTSDGKATPRFQPGLNAQQKADYMRRLAEQRCAHLVDFDRFCPKPRENCHSMGYCLQQYQSCTAFLPQAGTFEGPRDTQDAPPASPPQVIAATPPERQGRYKVWIANRCADPISVVFAFEDLHGGATKRGWMVIKPDRAQLASAETDSPVFAVHSTAGLVARRYRTGTRETLSIVNDSFDAPMEQDITGRGKRSVPFEVVRWDPSVTTPEIAIEQCDAYRWGAPVARVEAAVPVLPAGARDDRLYLQTRDQSYDLMEQSLAAGADPDARFSQSRAGWTPLFQAAKKWDGRALAILLQGGADANVRDRDGNTLLHVAVLPDGFVHRYNPAFFAALEAVLAEPGARNSAGLSPLGALATYRAAHPSLRPASDPVLRHLVDIEQPQPTDRFAGGQTLLHIAALTYDRPLAAKLLKAGWPADIRDDAGKLATDYARERSDEFYQLFLRRGEAAPAPQAAAPAVNPAGQVVAPPSPPVDPAVAAAREAERRKQLEAAGIAPRSN